ncbi:MAG: ABC transporter permease [Prevotellaceae bacterium]|jgi:ABC-2 type transport system permease protein|nr:ABC transporter permease [Prevotellaceae bacterium]
MKKLFLDIYYVWVKELKRIFKDEATLILFFLVPFVYPLLYTSIYTNEVVREVKVVAVDDSRSSLAREFVRKVDATADVEIIGYATDMEEAEEAMRRKDAYGILYIPEDFSRKLHTQQQTQVMVYADMSSILFYKNMLLSATEVSLDMGTDIRINTVGYGTQAQDKSTAQAVANEWVTLYNPRSGFAGFLIPAVLVLIIQQTLLLGISTIIGTHNDKKTHTIASRLRIGKNVNAFRFTVGKALAYVLIYMFISVWIFRVVPYLFRLPQMGDPVTIGVFIFPFLLAATFFSMTLSYFCSQREFSMLLFVFTGVIFLFLSGVSWPWDAIPAPLKGIAYIIPSTPGIHGFIKINTMGATFQDVMPEFITLWIHAGVYCLTATLMYLWWIKNMAKKIGVVRTSQPLAL